MNRNTAVVTGGTKGIGRALVEKFAEQGFKIITCSRNEGELSVLKRQMEESYPACVLEIKVADLSKKDGVSQFASFIKEYSETVDVLINNTGVFIPGEIQKEDEGALELMMDTNLYSAYHLTRGVLSGMVEQKSGHIFNMCSVASIMAYPNGGSYCISKFALLGFTKVLREEMKVHNIKVSAILPGATLTASWDGVELPPERFMKAEDVAESVWSAYNMSPNSVVEEIIIRPQLGDL